VIGIMILCGQLRDNVANSDICESDKGGGGGNSRKADGSIRDLLESNASISCSSSLLAVFAYSAMACRHKRVGVHCTVRGLCSDWVAKGSKFRMRRITKATEAEQSGSRTIWKQNNLRFYLDVLQQSFNLHCFCVVCQGSPGLKVPVKLLVLV